MGASALSDLAKLLEQYESMLSHLQIEEKSSIDDICLNILIVRDQIQDLFQSQRPLSSKYLPTLSKLDKELKQKSELIIQHIPLAEWREIIKPSEYAWWWHFEKKPPAHPWNRLNWLWEGATLITLTIDFALVAAISSRFLAGGPDTLSALAIAGQSAVALLVAGGPLTKIGQQAIERLLQRMKLPKYLWHEAKLIMAVVFLLCLVGLQNSLPRFANFYVKRGIKSQQKFQTTSALANYKRATELDPSNTEAHFRLGSTYEQLLDLEQARSQYHIAMLGGCIEAYNNLGRLYLIEDEDFPAAALLLKQGFAYLENDIRITECISADENALKYAFLKNLGWAELNQSRYGEAKGDLQTAIELNDEKAAAYCLLAQVLEKEGHPDTLSTWKACLGRASEFNADEAQWIDMAQQAIEANTSVKNTRP
ncbi:tetratricopeptide repeat protein [Adonisia turfae]|uniref:Tetratricopeptide repeat protein n=1 Tax=Adonisia turfae CCMR0081 TaxID=2292702 RepID=A0A6M0RUR4_9CYAN|nr:tetratricopeptide repeat protein [Adonisia turfae]NEZ59997.1 tetratricopeptide repeat protein [Adonisia turfae CCMR0081]